MKTPNDGDGIQEMCKSRNKTPIPECHIHPPTQPKPSLNHATYYAAETQAKIAPKEKDARTVDRHARHDQALLLGEKQTMQIVDACVSKDSGFGDESLVRESVP